MISRTALYALKAIQELARLPASELGGAAAIAEKTGAPVNYLGKLLKLLAQDGLLESRKGLNGGFRLARLPAEITLFDIAEPIDHVSRWTSCFLGGGQCCEDAPCSVHGAWQVVRQEYLNFLKHTTIADTLST